MKLSANGISLEVEDHGSPDGEPLLLVMGLGMQLTAWPDELVQMLVARGFRVIRFDNRDVGLSQGFDQLGVPNVAVAAMKFAFHLPIRPPYPLSALADDAVGVLDALGIAQAHVCGASMGGMVAQLMAIHHPQRLKSLTLMMTSTGSRRVPMATPEVRRALLSRPENPRDPASIAAHLGRFMHLIGSPAYRPDPAWMQARLRAAVDRAYRPAGTARQLVAIAADGDRSRRLAGVKLPCRVIHGQADPLVPVGAAHDLARKIAGSELDLIDGMGHDLPLPLLPRFTQGIALAAGRA
ncbi:MULTISPECIES: alpha/beta fold hydrolase [unclassified Rhizobacter]|uniref:alpha/beta fold hydrolase n=1 Tax=unclassified Rhizobacter TaxID=2640088 RepID=UPI0006F48C2E|nr:MULTISPECIES: alpha/beta hydrolase [unclassified Rhizobacter]KQU75670.1 alpha/beta hydrolase [Rhizobacter sp. Root29]KQW07388.1 alpha/beta hydrolase [Rhizobacter sp. Root1238]KRB18043.1 alpha/beta hydrolase [Rhizobacter sp. Root16D2]